MSVYEQKPFVSDATTQAELWRTAVIFHVYDTALPFLDTARRNDIGRRLLAFSDGRVSEATASIAAEDDSLQLGFTLTAPDHAAVIKASIAAAHSALTEITLSADGTTLAEMTEIITMQLVKDEELQFFQIVEPGLTLADEMRRHDVGETARPIYHQLTGF